jgi:hypothetical protein
MDGPLFYDVVTKTALVNFEAFVLLIPTPPRIILFGLLLLVGTSHIFKILFNAITVSFNYLLGNIAKHVKPFFIHYMFEFFDYITITKIKVFFPQKF